MCRILGQMHLGTPIVLAGHIFSCRLRQFSSRSRLSFRMRYVVTFVVQSKTPLKRQALILSLHLKASPGYPSLQTEGKHITEMLVQSLQSRVAVTGARIMSFDLVDLSYAPEIASHMLVRQQAAALVDARKIIVEAAVDMTHTAIESLEAKGRPIDDQTKNGIASNLLTVICSNESVRPVVNTNSGSNRNASNEDVAVSAMAMRMRMQNNE